MATKEMLSTMSALAAFASMLGQATAAVHAVAMYMRTGERTPLVGPDTVRLTSVGAQQAFAQGQMFRSRYLEHSSNDSRPFAPLTELSMDSADAIQTIILTPDNQYSVGSAQAFMQGFYPPHAPDVQQISDLSSIMSDSSIVDNPMNGYVYPMIHTASPLSPNGIFVSGADNCNNWAISSAQYAKSQDYMNTLNATNDLYGLIGLDLLEPLFPRDSWYYGNAYYVYDYVRYQYEHNSTVFKMFNDTDSQAVLNRLRFLADQHEWAVNAYLDTSGPTQGDDIRAIAGRTLAAKMLGFLQNNVATSGGTNKFNLIVGDYDPMIALFSLLSLPNINTNFFGLPDYGSVLVFELYSNDDSNPATGSDTTYPDPANLWVRFYFRNTTDFGSGLASDAADDSNNYQAYPILARGPSETDVMWSDFETEMSRIMMNEVSDWCDTCASYSVFCPAFEQGTSGSGNSVISESRGSSRMSPAAAGAIGAVVTLGIALLAFLIAMLLGVRVARSRPSALGKKPSGLGGFKGSAKLASDVDVSIAKNGAAMGAAAGGAVVTTAPVRAHERMGSWELREPTSPSSLGETLGKEIEAGWRMPEAPQPQHGRPSFDAGDEHGMSPVHPRVSL